MLAISLAGLFLLYIYNFFFFYFILRLPATLAGLSWGCLLWSEVCYGWVPQAGWCPTCPPSMLGSALTAVASLLLGAVAACAGPVRLLLVEILFITEKKY